MKRQNNRSTSTKTQTLASIKQAKRSNTNSNHNRNLSKQKVKPVTNFQTKNQELSERFRPSETALRNIRKLDKIQNLLIRKKPFQNVCRTIAIELQMKNNDQYQMRFSSQSLGILQQVSEQFIINLLSDSQACAQLVFNGFLFQNYQNSHGKRVTLFAKDLKLAKRIRGFDTQFGEFF